jgi:hypothetical protein
MKRKGDTSNGIQHRQQLACNLPSLRDRGGQSAKTLKMTYARRTVVAGAQPANIIVRFVYDSEVATLDLKKVITSGMWNVLRHCHDALAGSCRGAAPFLLLSDARKISLIIAPKYRSRATPAFRDQVAKPIRRANSRRRGSPCKLSKSGACVRKISAHELRRLYRAIRRPDPVRLTKHESWHTKEPRKN